MKRQDFRFFHRLRVRWVEVDMQKIVFNAHYLMYFDTAMADYAARTTQCRRLLPAPGFCAARGAF